MKKDRDCGANAYPIYPNYPMPMAAPGMIPMQGINYSNMSNPYMNNTNYSNNDQLSNIEQQINMLDRRITRLENMSNEQKMNQYQNTNYSDSNYHMM